MRMVDNELSRMVGNGNILEKNKWRNSVLPEKRPLRSKPKK